MTERQANLLRKAHRALRVPKDLMKLGHLEDAASRAYYSMFYVAEAFLDGEGLHFSTHSAVISEFGRLFAKTGRLPSDFHLFLKEAQHDRLGADYAELCTLTREETQEHLEHAENFLKLADNLIGPLESPDQEHR